jgi:hypothetical protein
VARRVAAIREHVSCRSASASASAMRRRRKRWPVADAVVIGSRIIQELENTPKEQGPQAVRAFVAGIRRARRQCHIACMPDHALHDDVEFVTLHFGLVGIADATPIGPTGLELEQIIRQEHSDRLHYRQIQIAAKEKI